MAGDLTFGLVHGAWHQGACWQPLAKELADRGFPSRAVDLPAEQEEAGADAYAAAVTEALRDVSGPLVLVGHSMGGLTIPVVAARRPVALLVYLCALLPDPGRSVTQQQADDGPSMMTPEWHAWTVRRNAVPAEDRLRWTRETVPDFFYHDCPPQDAARATAQLRQQGMLPLREQTPLTTWPSVPAEYILCREDRVISPAWSRHVVPQRLAVKAREFPGGHSPFLARPAALADELLAAAAAHGLPAPE
jgi:pimeloyl-ACP methyl ester carboxylesterase